jgi:hypothetical protein
MFLQNYFNDFLAMQAHFELIRKRINYKFPCMCSALLHSKIVMLLEIEIMNPLILFPISWDREDFLFADLGKIRIKNEYYRHNEEGSLASVYQVFISQLKLETVTHLGMPLITTSFTPKKQSPNLEK